MESYYTPGVGMLAAIRFNDHVFSEPVRLAGWEPPKCAGVYAILIPDLEWAPRSYQVLYFGEFGNNARQIASMQEYTAWLNAARGKELYIALLPLAFSTTAQRWQIRDELIRAYNPSCHASAAATGNELTRKIEELERRNEEQTAQLRLVLAAVGKLFEPQAEPPRTRRIGFLPADPLGGTPYPGIRQSGNDPNRPTEAGR